MHVNPNEKIFLILRIPASCRKIDPRRTHRSGERDERRPETLIRPAAAKATRLNGSVRSRDPRPCAGEEATRTRNAGFPIGAPPVRGGGPPRGRGRGWLEAAHRPDAEEVRIAGPADCRCQSRAVPDRSCRFTVSGAASGTAEEVQRRQRDRARAHRLPSNRSRTHPRGPFHRLDPGAARKRRLDPSTNVCQGKEETCAVAQWGQ